MTNFISVEEALESMSAAIESAIDNTDNDNGAVSVSELLSRAAKKFKSEFNDRDKSIELLKSIKNEAAIFDNKINELRKLFKEKIRLESIKSKLEQGGDKVKEKFNNVINKLKEVNLKIKELLKGLHQVTMLKLFKRDIVKDDTISESDCKYFKDYVSGLIELLKNNIRSLGKPAKESDGDEEDDDFDEDEIYEGEDFSDEDDENGDEEDDDVKQKICDSNAACESLYILNHKYSSATESILSLLF